MLIETIGPGGLGCGLHSPVDARRANLRAVDADRDAFAERLATATNEGRLEPGEFGLERVCAARSFAGLDALVADLSEPSVPAPTGDRVVRRRGCCGKPEP